MFILLIFFNINSPIRRHGASARIEIAHQEMIISYEIMQHSALFITKI